MERLKNHPKGSGFLDYFGFRLERGAGLLKKEIAMLNRIFYSNLNHGFNGRVNIYGRVD